SPRPPGSAPRNAAATWWLGCPAHRCSFALRWLCGARGGFGCQIGGCVAHRFRYVLPGGIDAAVLTALADHGFSSGVMGRGQRLRHPDLPATLAWMGRTSPTAPDSCRIAQRSL